jgi:hypothetical protein
LKKYSLAVQMIVVRDLMVPNFLAVHAVSVNRVLVVHVADPAEAN